MSSSRIMKWITGSFELILGIPVLGALIILGYAYVPLGIMFILHVITLVMSMKNGETKYGSVVGIVTSLIAWIPFVGMAMHIISGILLMVSAAKSSERGRGYMPPPPPPL
ncbi:MAG: hypothetical protein K0Q63_2239 [Paenibacillus sp.]|nr:hypothetical protein [Paenibacillus sp.]